MALLPGDLLHGRYRILAPLGVGGMGSVWAAEDEVTHAARVVKELRLDAPELLTAFRGECALLSRLSHPCLVRVLDFGSAHLRGELVHYYAAERIQGRTLGEHASASGLSPVALLQPLLDALEGLAVLHEARLCHGDFTPSNVLVREDGSGVLIDLGLTRPFGAPLSLGGTAGFFAPELLLGAGSDARSDSFAVGATLRRCFELAGLAPPPEVARLIERACREDPARRPADAREILEALGRRARLSEQLSAPAELVGREAEIARFEGWFRTLRDAQPGPRVLCISAAPGMGLSRLVQELLWRSELEVATLRAHAGEGAAVGRLLATATESQAAIRSVSGVLAALAALQQRSEKLVLLVEDYERLEPAERQLLFALARLLADSGPVGLLISGQAPLPGIACQELGVGPLSLSALRRWTNGLLSEDRLLSLQRVTGGSPARLEAALRELAAPGKARATRALDERARQAISALTPSLRGAIALISVLGGELLPDSRLLGWSELEPLLAAGLLGREGERVRLHHETAFAIQRGALSPSELSRAHLSAAEWRLASEALPGEPLLRFALAIEHFALAGDLAQAENLYLQLSAELLSAARSSAKPLSALAKRSKRGDLLLSLSELLQAGGLPRAALSAASRAMRQKPEPHQRLRATTLASDALVRLGRPARAELLLGRLLTRTPQSGAPELAERVARARLARADYQGALRTAEAALADAAQPELEGRLRETIGVAMAYLGDLARAELELGAAWSLLAQTATPRERCRIQSHRATVAFRAGRIEAALANYAGALALAEQHQLDDLVASGLLNLGTAEQQSGAWGSALRHYQRGALFARAIGRETTELTLEFNLANLYAELGAFERAEERLSALERRASGARLAHFAPALLLVRAETRLLLADPAGAESLLEAAAPLLRERAQPRELFEIELRRAEASLLRQDLASAATRLHALRESASNPSLGELRLALSALEARLRVASGGSAPLTELEAACREAEKDGLLPLQALLETTLFELLEARGEPDPARSHGERARRLWDRISAEVPEAFGATFWAHPRRARIAELSRTSLPAGITRSADAEPYRRLLSLNRRLNSSLSVARVLEYALESAV
ncbi:MAG TPA: serine/threonine-protein kinase, partial [Polyangiaceae bacterium]